jgi:excisionase family DNA binding protein
MTDVGPEALDLLTVDEVAVRLRCSVRTVRRLVYAERKKPGTGLESVPVGSLVRIPPEAVLAYKDRLRAAARAAGAAAAASHADTAPPDESPSPAGDHGERAA